MESINNENVIPGQAVYSKLILAFYDLIVLGISNRFIWKTPTPKLLKFYKTHISNNHMDIGVGTGYYLDHSKLPNTARIVLIDLNQNSLDVTARRIKRYNPKCYRRNALESLEIGEKGFDSIGVNYLLHCMPGNLYSKSKLFEHTNAYLNPGGTVFGATLLHYGVQRSKAAQKLMQIYNRKGIFGNTEDSLDALKTVLEKHYRHYTINIIGCAAYFYGKI